MSYYINGRKVAGIAKRCLDWGFSKVGDYEVWEEHSIGDVKFLHTASFILRSDAVTYCRAKYPNAEERHV